MNITISILDGGPGAVAPPNWRNCQKSAPLGQTFALSPAKILVNNGLCVGQPP